MDSRMIQFEAFKERYLKKFRRDLHQLILDDKSPDNLYSVIYLKDQLEVLLNCMTKKSKKDNKSEYSNIYNSVTHQSEAGRLCHKYYTGENVFKYIDEIEFNDKKTLFEEDMAFREVNPKYNDIDKEKVEIEPPDYYLYKCSEEGKKLIRRVKYKVFRTMVILNELREILDKTINEIDRGEYKFGDDANTWVIYYYIKQKAGTHPKFPYEGKTLDKTYDEIARRHGISKNTFERKTNLITKSPLRVIKEPYYSIVLRMLSDDSNATKYLKEYQEQKT